MRKDITFDSKGLSCRGWLYTPGDIDTNQKVPTIVMAHGLSAVKEQALPGFAERFAEAGLRTLLFDYRYFGSSDGEPRCQLFPLEMVEDYRNAITWVCEQPNVDAIMAVYERATQPKELIVHPIKHFDVYKDPWLTTAANEAIAWFKQHLV